MSLVGEGPVLHKLIRIGLFLSVIAIPLSTITCNALLITTACLSSVEFLRTRRAQFNLGAFPIIIFVLFILSFLYSDNLRAGVASLELLSSWLFIPVIFAFSGVLITSTFRKSLLVAFVISVLITCAGGYIILVLKSGQFYPTDIEGEFYYQGNPFSRVAFSEITNIHPSYLSIYLLFSMVIIVGCFPVRLIFKVALIVVIFLFLLIMSAKNQIGLFFLVVSVLIWNYINLRRRYKTIIILTSVILAASVALLSDEVRYRFQGELDSTLGDRIILWSAGMEIISDNPLLGVGIGDTDDQVNGVLKKLGYERLFNFNLHNQYLDYWLMLGLAGPVVFILILLAPWRYRDFQFRMFTVIVGLSMLTESLMYRQKGLVFFLVFYGIYGAGYLLKADFKQNGSIPQDTP